MKSFTTNEQSEPINNLINSIYLHKNLYYIFSVLTGHWTAEQKQGKMLMHQFIDRN